jgi:aldose 1-epimerase
MLFLAACGSSQQEPERSPESVLAQPFGEVDGRQVSLFTLRNPRGMEARVTNYGGIITHLFVPDRDGNMDDVVLGYDSLAGYLEASPYFGSIIGRYGNRIAGGTFALDGVTYDLARNNGPNHLHGGLKGFDKVVWEAEPFERSGARGIVFSYTSEDGEEGYPGTLRARVTYTLTDNDELIFDYHATTDKPTPVNLTQHTYFNLEGHNTGDILDHEMMINADRFTPIDSTLIPVGELRPVEGTPLDFRQPEAIGTRIDQDDEQIRFGLGYDHNFVLNGEAGQMKLVGRVYEPASGRVLEVRSTEPGVQFYSGNFLDGSITGKDGAVYAYRNGFCLETQHFPDSPNQPDFPDTILRPDEEYSSRTIYSFYVGDQVEEP